MKITKQELDISIVNEIESINDKVSVSEKGVANGLATLDDNGKVSQSQIDVDTTEIEQNLTNLQEVVVAHNSDDAKHVGVMKYYAGVANDLTTLGVYYVTGSDLVGRGFPLNLGFGHGLFEVFTDDGNVVHQRFSFNGYGYMRSRSSNKLWTSWSAFANANGDYISEVDVPLVNGVTGGGSVRKTMAGQVEVDFYLTFPSVFYSSTLIATLPSDLRPRGLSVIPMLRSADGNFSGHWVYAQSNGTIRIANGSTIPPAGVGYKFIGLFF